MKLKTVLCLATALALFAPEPSFGAPAIIGLGDSIMWGKTATTRCVPLTVHNISSFLNKSAWFCKVAQWYYANNGNTGTELNLASVKNGVVVADAHTNVARATALGLTSKVSDYFDQLAGTNQSNATVVFVQVGINNSQNIESYLPGGDYCGTIALPCSDATFAAQFHADYSQLIADIKTYAPSAQIVLGNVGNLAYLNESGQSPDTNTSSQSPDTSCVGLGMMHGTGKKCGTADRWSRIVNADINARASITPDNSSTFIVVDWACDPDRYNPVWNDDTLGGAGAGINGIHPQDPGHAALATLIENTITTPVLPAASGCMVTNYSGTVENAPSANFSPY